MKRYWIAGLAFALGSAQADAVKPTPADVKVACQTTKGVLDIVVHPSWAPLGAARFLQLVDDGYFKDMPLFRCVDNMLCQFGQHPPMPTAKHYPNIDDDAKTPGRMFKRGYLSFAGNGPNSRASDLFITLADQRADGIGGAPWEVPIAEVTQESMQQTVNRFNMSYGDMPPWGKGPDPRQLTAADGAAYLQREFPALDYIRSCQRSVSQA
jgi:cyclophilin family peptidyl-prolyl cis-trans isomerase